MAKNKETPDQPMLIEIDDEHTKKWKRCNKAVEAAAAEAENARNVVREKKKARAKASSELCEAHKIKPDEDGRVRFSVDGFTVIGTHADKWIVKRAKEDRAGKAPKAEE